PRARRRRRAPRRRRTRCPRRRPCSTGRRAGRWRRMRSSGGLAGDPDELERVLVERPPVEPAVERLRLEAADLEQALPLGSRRPPEPNRAVLPVAATAGEVDAIV